MVVKDWATGETIKNLFKLNIMKEQEKHKVGEWLKGQESELKINPSHYFDLIELIYNYHKDQLKLAKVTSMTDLEIQKYIEDNLRNCQGGEMMDEQIFYEGAKWYRDYVVNKLPVQSNEITISIQEYESLRRDSENLNKVDFGI